jgi:hypothetical protein
MRPEATLVEIKQMIQILNVSEKKDIIYKFIKFLFPVSSYSLSKCLNINKDILNSFYKTLNFKYP